MAFQSDYILRMIEDMAQFLRKAIDYVETGEIQEIVTEDGILNETAFLEYRLNKLYYQGEFCRAEELLLQRLEAADGAQYFSTALQFYQRLSQTDTARLEADGYSEERIMLGLKRLRELYPQVSIRFEDDERIR